MRMIVSAAPITRKEMLVGPALPIDVAPGDPVSLTDKSNEFFQVPVLINFMLTHGAG